MEEAIEIAPKAASKEDDLNESEGDSADSVSVKGEAPIEETSPEEQSDASEGNPDESSDESSEENPDDTNEE